MDKNEYMNPRYKVVLEVVDPAQLKDMQAKLNQWITTKQLVDYQTQPLPNGSILFKIVQLKQE